MLKSLPVLDISLLDQGEETAQEFRDQLLEATHKVGFFYLTGHGIPNKVIDAIFSEARAFFALPLERKMEVEMLRSPHFRGYTRMGGEYTQGKTDWREQIDFGPEQDVRTGKKLPDYIRLEGPNLWPKNQPNLKTVFLDWQKRCSALGLKLMRSWALALENPENIFDSAFSSNPYPLIKIVKYPGRAERGQGVGAHKDPGIMTLLMIEPNKGGLQVLYRDKWIDVAPMKNAFIVNIGELMEYATNGYLKATTHRVESPKQGDSRLSIPFFFNPALDSTVSQLSLSKELAKKARGVTQDPLNKISGTFGENILKARLRAHPDVAARYHADLLLEKAGSSNPV